MEKKTTQRIIGILVAIALLVVLMPLVFSKNDISTQTAALKAPPFPGQEQPQDVNPANDTVGTTAVITQEMADKVNGTSVAPAAPETKSAENNVSPLITQTQDVTAPATPSASSEQPVATTSSAEQAAGQPSVNPLPEQSAAITPQTASPQGTASQPISDAQSKPSSEPTDASKPSGALQSSASLANPAETAADGPDTHTQLSANQSMDPTASVKQETAAAPSANDVSQPSYSTISSAQKSKMAHAVAMSDDHAVPAFAKEKKHKVMRTTANTHANVHHKTFANLKQPGWVVQMGSFRDKDNARRLANRLRVAGYKAFMREVKSNHGSLQTRVYIGPEVKQASASRLSTKLQQDMNLHGFVTSYKPFEL